MTESEALARRTAAGAAGADTEFAGWLTSLSAQVHADGDGFLAAYLAEAAAWHAGEGL